jgi:hypothetical protein
MSAVQVPLYPRDPPSIPRRNDMVRLHRARCRWSVLTLRSALCRMTYSRILTSTQTRSQNPKVHEVEEASDTLDISNLAYTTGEVESTNSSQPLSRKNAKNTRPVDSENLARSRRSIYRELISREVREVAAFRRIHIPEQSHDMTLHQVALVGYSLKAWLSRWRAQRLETHRRPKGSHAPRFAPRPTWTKGALPDNWQSPKLKPKDILKPPRQIPFPEDPNPTREGVAPLKSFGKQGTPSGARWTKISRMLVNPAALEAANERYEERDAYVIVLQVLFIDDIQKLADNTKEIRGRFQMFIIG